MIWSGVGKKVGLATGGLVLGFLATWAVLENAPRPAAAATAPAVRRVENLPPARVILPAPWEPMIQQSKR